MMRRCSARWRLGTVAEAFEALLHGYQRVVVQFCTTYLGNAADGHDVAQEVFVALWRALPRYEQRGALMGVGKLLHGLVGSASPTMSHITVAVTIMGAVQALIGLSGAKAARENVLCLPKARGYIVGFCVFGLLTMVAHAAAFLAFRSGARADMSTNTFIVSVLMMVPLALIGHFGFQERLQWRQVGGGAIACVGGGLLLSPAVAVGESVQVPPWVWWSLVTLGGASGTHTVAKLLGKRAKEGKLPPLSLAANIFVLQFWGGLVMSVMPLMVLPFMHPGLAVLEEVGTLWRLIVFALFSALTNIGWWSCRQLSFQHGAPLLFRMLPWLACYLSTATLAGVVVFHDPLPWQKVGGLLLFAPAICVYEGGWQYCSLAGLRRFWKSLPSLTALTRRHTSC